MEITDGIHLINGVRGPNIYLLVDEDLTLIDSGFPGNGRVIAQYIEGIGRSLDELKRVLITHSHPDHTGSVPELKDMVPALQVMAHRADTSRDSQGRYLVSYLNVFGATRLPVPFLRRVEADGFLEEGQTLPIRGGLRVIHTPGHTPGSVCFYLESRRVIFCGGQRGEYGGIRGRIDALPQEQHGAVRRVPAKNCRDGIRYRVPGSRTGIPGQCGPAHPPNGGVVSGRTHVAPAGSRHSARLSTGQAERLQGDVGGRGALECAHSDR